MEIIGINNFDKQVSVSSLQNLIKKYNSYTRAISRTLDLFSIDRINLLTADGKVNALNFLLETLPACKLCLSIVLIVNYYRFPLK